MEVTEVAEVAEVVEVVEVAEVAKVPEATEVEQGSTADPLTNSLPGALVRLILPQII